jgi:hypothetical protein
MSWDMFCSKISIITYKICIISCTYVYRHILLITDICIIRFIFSKICMICTRYVLRYLLKHLTYVKISYICMGGSELFSVEFIKLCAGTSPNLDGSIKPSSIPRLETSQNSLPAKATPWQRPGPGQYYWYLPVSLETCTKLYQCTIWALIHGSESNGCHGQHRPRRETIQNLKYTPKTVSLGSSGRASMVFQS